MNINELKETLPSEAKDVRLNLSTLFTEEGAPGLTEIQRLSVALSCAYALENAPLLQAVLEESSTVLDDAHRQGAKVASQLMAMNNIYYRFLHLAGDEALRKLPARLRMNAIAQPGVDKTLFELNCLAVSALAGCESCIRSHIAEVRKGGIENVGIQTAARLASVLRSVSHTLKQTEISNQ